MAQAKNPASIFLKIAAANGVATLVFIIIYFLHRNAGGGERSIYLMIAAGGFAVATVGAIFAYNYFRKKLESRG